MSEASSNESYGSSTRRPATAREEREHLYDDEPNYDKYAGGIEDKYPLSEYPSKYHDQATGEVLYGEPKRKATLSFTVTDNLREKLAEFRDAQAAYFDGWYEDQFDYDEARRRYRLVATDVAVILDHYAKEQGV